MTFGWLIALAKWLDSRFPPKVVVTKAIYDALQIKEHKHSQEIAALQGANMVLRDRVQSVEKSLVALKDGISKGNVPLSASDKDRLRSEFVRGEGDAWGRPQASPVVPAGS